MEDFSIDECFLDMTGIVNDFKQAVNMAYEIKNRIKNELGFTVNVRIGGNNLCAKMASDFEKNTITISHTVSQCIVDGKFETVSKDRAKTKSSHRTLPLVPHFKKVLLDLKKKQEFYREVCGNCYSQKYLDYVYVNKLGELIKPDYITSRFKHIVTSNKLKPLRFHDPRHSCANLLYENGVSLKNIQERLGHSQLSTTSDIYTHLDYKSKISSANAIMGLLA